MNSTHFSTFIRVADAGSFNKAAEEMYITSTAVIKQINLLENDLGVRLFDRTHRGLTLTKAGVSLYKDVKYMIGYCREAVARAKGAMQEDGAVIRIGTSPMTPAQLLTDLWTKIHAHCTDINFQLVPYENTPENAREILRNLGRNIDVVTGIFDETLLELRKCAGFEITKEPFCCALSIYHPLASKERLTLQDLYGENLMVIHRGWSHYVDKLRDELAENHGQIQIVDFELYSLEVFNQCEQSKDVLLVIESWKYVHPMMRVIPVEWDYSIPFGLLHSPNPSETVKRFISAVKKVLQSEL